MARSIVTEDGQTAVPDEIRQKLDLSAGSVLEWEEDGDRVILRPARRRFTSEEIHKAIFKEPPQPKTVDEMDEGIREYILEKHARR